jgi:hypothetical protein
MAMKIQAQRSTGLIPMVAILRPSRTFVESITMDDSHAASFDPHRRPRVFWVVCLYLTVTHSAIMIINP